MSHFSKILKWVVNILSGFLLVILALVVYGRATIVFTDNRYPNYFGYTLFSIASGSMEPALYMNDVILVKMDNEDIQKDDIITYQKDGEIITHRVIFTDGKIYTVKGDNNNTIDNPISKDVIIGKVVKIFPKLGVWQKIVTEPKILIAIFITLLLFDFAISYKGQEPVKKEPKNKKEPEKDVIIKQIEEQEQKEVKETKENKNDKLKKEELLELTRTINLDDIQKLLDEDDIKEKPKIKRKVRKNNKKEKKEVDDDYTIRLDLNEIQKNIRKKVK